jgi:magnesium chelatase family protein
MLACLSTLLPAMTLVDRLDTTRLHPVADCIGGRTTVVTTRPCRAPHRTISDVGLIGGSRIPLPGEASRAHHGMLFLDELPEFKRHVREVLRPPLENGFVTITRMAICFISKPSDAVYTSEYEKATV